MHAARREPAPQLTLVDTAAGAPDVPVRPQRESVRKAVLRMKCGFMAMAATFGMMRVRNTPPSQLSETTNLNARSVVESSRSANGRRSTS